MKRSECTAESLRALGYQARRAFTSWNNCSSELVGNQADEVFNEIAKATRNGEKVEIIKNVLLHEVIATIPQMRHEYRGTVTVYYISRPMTEAERLEADQKGLWK